MHKAAESVLRNSIIIIIIFHYLMVYSLQSIANLNQQHSCMTKSDK